MLSLGLGPVEEAAVLVWKSKAVVAASLLPLQLHYIFQPMQRLSHYRYCQSYGNHPVTEQILLQPAGEAPCTSSSAAKEVDENIMVRLLWASFALSCVFFSALYGHLQPVSAKAAGWMPHPGTAISDWWSIWCRTQGIHLEAVIHHYMPHSMHFRA